MSGKLSTHGGKQSLWIISLVKACRPLTSNALFNHLYFSCSAPPTMMSVSDRWIKLQQPGYKALAESLT